MYLDNQPDYKIKDTRTFTYQNDYAYQNKGEKMKFLSLKRSIFL